MRKILVASLLVTSSVFVFADVNDGLTGIPGVSPGNVSSAKSSSPSDSSSQVVPPIVGLGDFSPPSGVSNYLGNNKANVTNVTQKNNEITYEVITRSNESNTLPDPFIDQVYVRTGVKLKKFGSDGLGSLGLYSQTKNIPVPANYIIVPGDTIQAQSWGAVDGDVSLTVAADGTVFIPKVGEINLAGVKAGQLNSYMSAKLGKIYRNFSLTSNVAKIQSIPIVVTGMAANPGVQLISSLSTLSSAIGKVGGPSSMGSLRNVELIRNGKIVEKFDLYSLLMNGQSKHDVELEANDVIKFKPLGPEVAIYDGVKRPAIYEIKSGETIQDLINFAGGYTSDANKDKIVVETIGDNQAIKVNNFETEKALHSPLSAGMIVHFFKSFTIYESSVALVGNVAHPSRYGFFDGMRVSDLIPNNQALLTESYYNSIATISINKLSDNNNNNNNSDDGLNLTSGLQSSQNLSNTKDVFNSSDKNILKAGPVSIPQANINWNYAVVIRTNPVDFTIKLITFNLRKAIEKDPENDLELQPGDLINVLSAADARGSKVGKPVYVFIDGEVNAPGVYELRDGQTLRDVIDSAGGVSDKAYLFGMELTRKSVQRQQTTALHQMLDQAQQNVMAGASEASVSNINDSQGRAQSSAVERQLALIDKMRKIVPSGRIVLNMKDGNATAKDVPDFKLDNGDTVYIPSRPDVVNVVGQVYNPSTFMFSPKSTVRKYINLAGGENNFADTSSEYVLRADGSLYNKQQSGWFGGFDGRVLNPGDVVIIPQHVQTGNTLLNVMNWTQILANTAQAVILFNR